MLESPGSTTCARSALSNDIANLSIGDQTISPMPMFSFSPFLLLFSHGLLSSRSDAGNIPQLQHIPQMTRPIHSLVAISNIRHRMKAFRPLLSDRHTPYKCISDKGTSCPKKRATFMPIYPKHRVQVSRSPTYPETTTRTQ